MSSDSKIYSITCNHCDRHLDATAIKTSCNHLFCLVCATKYFSVSTACPLCHRALSENDVSEIIIGIAPMPLKQCMLQTVLQNREWEHIIEASFALRQAAEDVTSFVQKQLIYTSCSNFARKTVLAENIEEGKAELVNFVYIYCKIYACNWLLPHRCINVG